MSQTEDSRQPGDSQNLVASSEFATQLIAELVQLGVRDVVVCPGSRSQALALAAAEAEALGWLRLHVKIDERSAAFFALGVAVETGMPAPIIVTSGTAVANLAPAVFEAHEGRVPLLLLTADRPAESHDRRTSQTTRQYGLFAAHARLTIDAAPPEFLSGNHDQVAVTLSHVGHVGDVVDRAVDAAAGALAATDGGSGRAATPTDIARLAIHAAVGAFGSAPAGPVHLNLAFREPLSGSHSAIDEARADRPASEHSAAEHTEVLAAADPPGEDTCEHRGEDTYEHRDEDTYKHRGDALTVVVAGSGAGDEAEAFAHAAGLPLLAEVVSGARFGRETITAYATLIDDESIGGLIEQVIVFGHPTLTRQIPGLLAREDVDVVVVDAHHGNGVPHFRPCAGARVVRQARVATDHDARIMRRWLGAWVVPDRELREARSTVHAPDLAAATAVGYKERSAYARTEVTVMREPVSRRLLVESVWRATWPHDRLIVAASRLVRVLDQLAQARHLRVHSNRGVAGIDGTIATALGIAATSQAHANEQLAAGTTRVLLGDLALLHDAGSLLLEPSEPRPRIQLIVGNDRGGTIFGRLEVAESADTTAFDRVMYTPQNVDIEHLAGAYGWEYQRVATRAELERLFTVPVTGPSIVEVTLPR